MKKIKLLIFVLVSVFGFSQNTYIDPTTTLALKLYSDNLEKQQQKTMTSQNKLATAAALLKFMGESTLRRQSSKGKYLSLSIKNGQSNVKSLIHQAMYTGIKDPRPYIKDLIQRELNRLTTDVSTMNLESIDYGFNIKLASQVSYFKGLKVALAKNDITTMDIQDAVNFYNFKKELVSYEKARIANNNICPYLWVSNHLKADVLKRPFLHAFYLVIKDPISSEDRIFKSDLAKDLAEHLKMYEEK
jgi:hypothetical protein